MSLSKSKIFIVAILAIITVSFGIYSYIYKPHKNVATIKVSYTGSTKDFLKKATQNATLWLDKVVLLKGKITQIDDNGITLDNSIYCQFENFSKDQFLIQTQITIKGNMIGYDDLLNEVKLNQCIVQK